MTIEKQASNSFSTYCGHQFSSLGEMCSWCFNVFSSHVTSLQLSSHDPFAPKTYKNPAFLKAHCIYVSANVHKGSCKNQEFFLWGNFRSCFMPLHHFCAHRAVLDIIKKEGDSTCQEYQNWPFYRDVGWSYCEYSSFHW